MVEIETLLSICTLHTIHEDQITIREDQITIREDQITMREDQITIREDQITIQDKEMTFEGENMCFFLLDSETSKQGIIHKNLDTKGILLPNTPPLCRVNIYLHPNHTTQNSLSG